MGHRHSHDHTDDHAHACEHGHDHAHHGGLGHVHVDTRDARALIIAMVSTGLIFVAQVIGGILSNSLALLSDAGHMLTDLSALVISYAALRIAGREKESYSSRYTYGLGRVKILAALLNGVLLLVMCAYIAYEAIGRLMAPEEVQTVPMLIVAAVGLAANAVSAFVLRGSKSLNTRSAYLHVITDLLSSVGVIVGGVVMYATGLWWVDPLLSLVIAVLIVKSGYTIVREAGIILLESAPGHIDVGEVSAAMARLEEVRGVHDVHIWQVDLGDVAISAHVVLDSFDRQEDVLQRLRALLKERFSIGHSTIQIESKKFAEREQCHTCSW